MRNKKQNFCKNNFVTKFECQKHLKNAVVKKPISLPQKRWKTGFDEKWKIHEENCADGVFYGIKFAFQLLKFPNVLTFSIYLFYCIYLLTRQDIIDLRKHLGCPDMRFSLSWSELWVLWSTKKILLSWIDFAQLRTIHKDTSEKN